MSDCILIETCIFFNEKMEKYPSTVDVMKIHYCKNNKSKCARYKVFKALGRENVPIGLFPDQIDVAKKIIFEENKK